MKTIWKHTFGKEGMEQVIMPAPLIPLKVDNQRGELVMWVEVDTDELRASRFYLVVPTGAPYPNGGRWVGSAQFMEGNLCLHVIEYLERPEELKE